MFRDDSDVSVSPSWQEYRRRARALRIAFLLFFLWPLFGTGTEYLLALAPNGPVAFLSAVLALICVAITYLRWLFWRCPQCGLPFRLSWTRKYLFASRCLHCGLLKWEVPQKTKVKSQILDEL
jgi:hypothetical protein